MRLKAQRETTTCCLQRGPLSFSWRKRENERAIEREREAGARLLNFDQVETADARREKELVE